MNIKSNANIYLIWLVTLAFCVFQFILRLFPGHIQTELMQHFHVNASEFGTFSAAYYLGYGGFLIPIAILMEKFGLKIVVALSILLCAIGCFLMPLSEKWIIAILSRFLIGMGSIAGFLGTTKAIIDYFPIKHHAKMIGFSMSIALLGALYGAKPVHILIDTFSWQKVLFHLGLIAIILCISIMIFAKKAKVNLEDTKINTLNQISALFKNKTFLILAIANFLMVGSLEGFADIWGINYLALAANIDKAQSSLITSFIFLGMLFGVSILSLITDAPRLHIKLTSLCGIFMAILTSLILFNPNNFNIQALKIVMLLIGVFSGYQALVFVIGKNLVAQNLSNTAIAALNCINMFGGAFFHKSIGIAIDYSVKFNIAQNIYSLKAYTFGLYLIPILSLIGGVLLLFIKINNKNI